MVEQRAGVAVGYQQYVCGRQGSEVVVEEEVVVSMTAGKLSVAGGDWVVVAWQPSVVGVAVVGEG